MLGYVLDEALREKLNNSGKNYWDVYIEEIIGLLGVQGKRLSLSDIERGINGNIDVLIIGKQSGQDLTDSSSKAIAEWTKAGGVLIGFGLESLGDVFGFQNTSTCTQKPDDYSIAGYFDFWKHSLTDGIHPLIFLEQKLPIISDIELIEKQEVDIIAGLYDTKHNALKHPAITWRAYGKGFAGYFAFDLAKTVWLLHQGRPRNDIAERRRCPRANEMRIVGPDTMKTPCADEMVLVLQNMIAQSNKTQAFIYQIPPENGDIPDALFYWGGDEYQGPVELSLRASDWMKEKGLPYHINIESENHPMTKDEFEHIRGNGHEVSAYYRLYEDDSYDMKEDTYVKQGELFYERFGVRPTVTVNYLLRWKGWAEPARWMLKAGGRADNSFSSNAAPLANHPMGNEGMHPLANSSYFGFGFGTSYPFYFYDDYSKNNERINFMEQPIICYEIGHYSMIPCSYEDYQQDPDEPSHNLEDVHLPIDMAIKYHMVMNFFIHPTNIAARRSGREAVEEILRYCEYKKALVSHMGNNAVAQWWDARYESKVEKISESSDSVILQCQCDYPAGIIIKMPVKKDVKLKNVLCDGKPIEYKRKLEFGGNWAYWIVPTGSHKIEIKFSMS